MRSSTTLLAFLIAACSDAQEVSKDAPLAIPAGDDGRPALPANGPSDDAAAGAPDRTDAAVAWREQLAKARVRYESLKAQASEEGQQVAASTDQLMQKTKDALVAAESRISKADEVAANEFEGFETAMDRDIATIQSDLKALEDSIAGDKSAAASREIEEDHE